MGILRTTLLALGAVLAVGAIVDRAGRNRGRFVQTTLDHLAGPEARPWP